MKLTDYVHILKDDRDFGPAVVYHRYLPSQEAEYSEDASLPHEIQALLPHLGWPFLE